MEIIEWWPKLDPATKEWLVTHNGEPVDRDVLAKIVAAGGSLTSDGWWIGEEGPDGFFLSDEATDWIEASANGESA
ncbi:hypothetical protein WDJ51_13235 [Rathayibacter sp. YIM 133350]|uniref:hypothetical protein n=1 Tax=Rathayibacter sp. YIM 133350 TaxID=3131992 RepID=UPI00307CD514